MRAFGSITLILVSCLCLAIPRAAGQTRAAADTVRYVVLMQGNRAGEAVVWTDEQGEWHERFRFNDRGRGPELRARVTLGEARVPVELSVEGADYLKSPVEESFAVQAGVARWRNQGEDDSRSFEPAALYVPMNGTPGMQGVAARALLEAEGGCLPLLPAGRACIEALRELEVVSDSEPIEDGPHKRLVLYAITGLGFQPSYLWLEEDGTFFGTAGGWLAVLPDGWAAGLDRLADAEEEAEDAWLADLARTIPERPDGPVAITGARLFDPITESVRPKITVVLQGNRIAAVGPDGEVTVPAGARVIEAEGRTLLPGLFDMHVHLSPLDGVLNLAAGVTSVRDLANDIDRLLEMRDAFETGRAIGPRVMMAGFMDGPGPYAGPTKVLVDTKEEVRDWVSRYAELGYEQIKMYSSIDTALVPAIVEAAHAHGLRVSGHIPAFMTAADAVRAGFDEIQHVNMLFLNFLGDTLDTRTPLRFTEVAKHGAELDLSADSVRSFIRLLKDRGVVVDPTVAVFEDMFTARPGTVSPAYETVADRLPPQVRRGFQAGGLPVPEGMDERYRASFQRMLDMVKTLHEAGVPIVAGTDALAGFTLHRELELYQKAGIPPTEVLRIATLGAAEVMGHADRLGSIEAGKLADLVLVEGDPTTDVAAMRRPILVVKDGVLYDPADLWRAVGVRSVVSSK